MRRLLGVLLVLAGCGDSEPAAAPNALWTTRAAALKSAASADAWRIGGDPAGGGDFFAYREISGPLALSEPQRKELVALLVDPKVLDDALHPCILNPGVKVRFTRPGGIPVWVFFCFECTEVVVYEDRQRREHKGFGGDGGALARFMKRIFPKDTAIQGLKER